MQFVVIAVFVCLVIGGIGFAIMADRKRTAAIEDAARELGLTYEKDPISLERETSFFHLMDRGRSRKHRNLISAVTDEVTIRLFDYRFTTGGGKNSTTHRQTVALIHSSLLRMPKFRARPEGMLDGIGGALGFQDIDFDDHKPFSDAFVLKSDMESETRAFFDHPLLDFFVTRPRISFEANGSSFLFYQARHSVKPADYRGLLEEAYKVFSLLRERSTRS